MSTRSPTATTLSPLRVASGRAVKKYQWIQARPSPLRDNVHRRLLVKISGTSWSSLAYWAKLVYCIPHILPIHAALVERKQQLLSDLRLLLNIDTVWILIGHIVTCLLPPSAVDKALDFSDNQFTLQFTQKIPQLQETLHTLQQKPGKIHVGVKAQPCVVFCILWVHISISHIP